jgi:hypothetical protein
MNFTSYFRFVLQQTITKTSTDLISTIIYITIDSSSHLPFPFCIVDVDAVVEKKTSKLSFTSIIMMIAACNRYVKDEIKAQST